MLNATELIDEVNDNCAEPTDGTGRWSDTSVLKKLNYAQSEVNLKIADLLRTVNVSLTPVAGQGTYAIPATIGKLYQVHVNGQPIQSIGDDSVSRYTSYTTEIGRVGTPWYYYVQNNNLILYPAPDSTIITIKLVGEILITELTNSSASYPFENVPYFTKAQKILVLFATADCMLIDGDQTQYQLYRGEAQNLLDELESDWNMYRTPESHSIVENKSNEDTMNQDTPSTYTY